MPVIKRYSNRKLYDTEAKQYVTLERIADLIRRGEEVHVVDHATGEDLTALTLTQIILEQQKKAGGFLPRTVLTSLIQAGGDTLHTVKRAMGSAASLAHQVDEEIERRILALVHQGELSMAEGQHLIEKLLAPSRPPQATVWPSEQDVEQALAARGVPTRDELRRLAQEVEALSAKLEAIGRSAQPDRTEE